MASGATSHQPASQRLSESATRNTRGPYRGAKVATSSATAPHRRTEREPDPVVAVDPALQRVPASRQGRRPPRPEDRRSRHPSSETRPAIRVESDVRTPRWTPRRRVRSGSGRCRSVPLVARRRARPAASLRQGGSRGPPGRVPPRCELSTFPVSSVLSALARVTVGPGTGDDEPDRPLVDPIGRFERWDDANRSERRRRPGDRDGENDGDDQSVASWECERSGGATVAGWRHGHRHEESRMTDVTVLRHDEMESSMGGGFVLAAKSLGVTSFGMNVAEDAARLRRIPAPRPCR